MKYLKTYKLFESSLLMDHDSESDIYDILSDISDDGVKVSVENQKGRLVISIGESMWKSDFVEDIWNTKINKYEDSILRLIDFIDEKGYKLSSFNYEYLGRGYEVYSRPGERKDLKADLINITEANYIYLVFDITIGKAFNLSENVTDDFLSDIHDILLDIEDSGLFIKKYRSYEGTDRLKLQITKNPEGRLTGKFEITQEIADTLYRLSDYVSRLGWSFCTFEIHLSGKEWYQLSKGDIQDYVGTEVWYITVDITDYRGPHWYEMRYGKNESIKNELYNLKTYNQVNEVSFNDLEKSANLRDECSDILLDISDDDRFTVDTWVEESDTLGIYDTFVVVIAVNRVTFGPDDKGVKFSDEQIESIKRLFDYLDSNGYDKYKAEIGTDNIPPMPDVNPDDYRGEIKPEDFNLAELWAGDYIRIDIKR